jgi:hypothetical protein
MTEIARRARLFLGSYTLLFFLLALRFHTSWLESACGVLPTPCGVGAAAVSRLSCSRPNGEPPGARRVTRRAALAQRH